MADTQELLRTGGFWNDTELETEELQREGGFINEQAGGAPPAGRIMSSTVAGGGLVGSGGIAGKSGGLAG